MKTREPTFELTTVDGEQVRVQLADFLADNPDLDEADEIRALRPGETLTGDGGAAPIWSIRKLERGES
jgi:hypothetical protein